MQKTETVFIVQKGRENMQTVNRIINILELLSKFSNGLMISEISEEVDLPISTTYRILNALKKRGYIAQDSLTKRYRLGMGISTLAIKLLNNNDIVNSARPYMEELSSKWEILVFIAVEENDKAICVSMVNNSNKVKFYVNIGSEMPLYCTSSSQVIFAYKTEKKIDSLLSQGTFSKLTPNTLTDPEDIKKKLCTIRELGYGICNEEMELGVKAISAPIKNRSNQVSASINIIGIKGDESIENETLMIKDLQNAALKISRSIGCID